MYAHAEYACKIKAEMSFQEGEYFARRCEQTNRQLLKAIESLARVRRLLTPLQVNIGQNQINVAQSCTPIGLTRRHRQRRIDVGSLRRSRLRGSSCKSRLE